MTKLLTNTRPRTRINSLRLNSVIHRWDRFGSTNAEGGDRITSRGEEKLCCRSKLASVHQVSGPHNIIITSSRPILPSLPPSSSSVINCNVVCVCVCNLNSVPFVLQNDTLPKLDPWLLRQQRREREREEGGLTLCCVAVPAFNQVPTPPYTVP